MGDRVEVIIKMDDRHSLRIEVRNEHVSEILKKYVLSQDGESKKNNIHSLTIEVRNEDINEIMRRYALVQNTEPKEIEILDFLNYRQN